MKAIPCARCGVARLADGKPYRLSAFPMKRRIYHFLCAGCKRTTSLTATEFNQLPDVKPEPDTKGKESR